MIQVLGALTVFVAGIPETPDTKGKILSRMKRRRSRGGVKHVRHLMQITEEISKSKAV